jgi:hypothetical protein
MRTTSEDEIDYADFATDDDKVKIVHEYDVEFRVRGYDHDPDGYCTDAEAEFMDVVRNQTVRKHHRVRYLSELDFENEGCTSATFGIGSGYCTGGRDMTQTYKAVRVLSYRCIIPRRKDGNILAFITPAELSSLNAKRKIIASDEKTLEICRNISAKGAVDDVSIHLLRSSLNDRKPGVNVEVVDDAGDIYQRK